MRTFLRTALVLGLIGAGVMGAAAWAKKPPTGGGSTGCPRDVQCLDVWQPVICDGGAIYSNSCYAYRACATGCVPYGADAS